MAVLDGDSKERYSARAAQELALRRVLYRLCRAYRSRPRCRYFEAQRTCERIEHHPWQSGVCALMVAIELARPSQMGMHGGSSGIRIVVCDGIDDPIEPWPGSTPLPNETLLRRWREKLDCR